MRKRLFDDLPSPDRIDEVAQAYVGALQKAKRVDTIPSTPETFIERIRETYPFHPSIRDIVARFAENRGYQKTRALIRLLRLAVRGALATNDNAFLVGLQHLDFNDQGTLEEIRKINPAYTNAISRDIADRGNALAEKIDAADGNSTASAVAKVLLMSSLSAAETPLRGLTDGELIEDLVDPLLEVSEIKAALARLQGQAWYLFQGVDHRVFFGQTANVTAEITDIAANIAEEQVDQTLRDKVARRCSSRELEASIPIRWRSCRASTKSSWTTIGRRSSFWSGLPTSCRRTSSTGGTNRTSRTECSS